MIAPLAGQIRSNVQVVLAPTTVLDRKGNFVNGLSERDFLVTDNGKPRVFQMDSPDDLVAPLSVVFAVQTSESSAAALAKVQKIGSMLQPLILGERGKAAVVGFDDDVRVVRDFTGDPSALGKAFTLLKPAAAGGSVIFDAMYKCEELLAAQGSNGRRVIVLVSESRDRGSRAPLDGVVATAQRDGIAIYPATYSAYATAFTAKPSDLPPPSGGSGLLGIITETARLGKTNAADALAQSTGGEHLSFLTQKSLERLISRLGEELHSQYLISFQPQPGTEAGHHAIQVTVRGHPEYVVHARPGYWWAATL